MTHRTTSRTSYAAAACEEAATRPYEVYHRLDLGPGGYAVAPARGAKAVLARVIAAKHQRTALFRPG